MNTEKKPIKRGKELVALSRDHHEGLLLSWKIRTGLKLETEPARIINYVLYSFDHHLRDHFAQEEAIVFPLLSETDERRTRAFAEHQHIYQMTEQMAANTDAATVVLPAFADFLEAHIRFEERDLFPYIEQQADRDALSKAGRMIEEWEQQQNKPQWEDEFWAKKR
jgi:iron-sulfur cluster repair protein YtfE (RIC family)